MTTEHNLLANDPATYSQHGITHKTVANAAALAAEVITASDVAQGRVFYQTDTEQRWFPKTVGAGATFKQLLSNDLVNTSLTNVKVVAYKQEIDDGNSGAADTIDWSGGQYHKSTITVNCTYTFTAPPGPCDLQLKIVQGGIGGFLATWPGSVQWIGGFPPVLSTTAGATDFITFYYDGAAYWGFFQSASEVDSVTITINGSGLIQRAALTGDVTAPAGSNTTAIAAGVIVNADVNAAAAIAGSKVSPDFGAQNVITTGNITVNGGYFAVGTTNLPSTGSNRWVNASTLYCISTALADSKMLHYTNGNAAVFGDNVSPSIYNGSTTSLRVSNTDYIVLSTSIVGLAVVNLRWDSGLTSPIIFQQTSAVNGITGQPLTGHAQDCSGTTTTGGNLVWRPGSGTTAGGEGRLQTGGATNRFRWNDTGIGFYTTAPVSQRTLTDNSTGTPATQLVDVTTTTVADPVKVNNNFASIRQLLNQYGLAA
jgi:hypothetical protein